MGSFQLNKATGASCLVEFTSGGAKLLDTCASQHQYFSRLRAQDISTGINPPSAALHFQSSLLHSVTSLVYEMPAPSKLSIASSSVSRLIREEASYHKEAEQQAKRIEKLESNPDDENAEYMIRQEVRWFWIRVEYKEHSDGSADERFVPQRRALQETEALFPGMKQQLAGAVQRLEEQLVCIGLLQRSACV